MPELSLDDDQRHTFASHLDGMGVAKLMRRKASAHVPPRAPFSPGVLACRRGPRPRVGSLTTQNSGPIGSLSRSSSQDASSSHP